MLAQCKGKDLTKIVPSKKPKPEDRYLCSIKYDGHYVQIHKNKDNVRFFTSGGKEFYLAEIAKGLMWKFGDKEFILECEYIGRSQGKLGDRTKVGKLTTYRTDFIHEIESMPEDDEKFIIFDILPMSNLKTFTAESRRDILHNVSSSLLEVPNLYVCDFIKLKFKDCDAFLKGVLANKMEGIYLVKTDSIYEPGKRLNTRIKIKQRHTADLLCVDTTLGEGKYIGMTGSLVLQDKCGRIVSVGSGLTDADRMLDATYFVGKVVEIEYEQILDTYIQPTFVGVRNDKSVSDID